jgi:hypothetical protein
MLPLTQQIGSYLENLKYLQSVPGPNYETPSTLDKIGVLLTSKPPDFSLKSQHILTQVRSPSPDLAPTPCHPL